MAVNVQGSPYSTSTVAFAGENLGYTYPDGVNLKPGSIIHEKLKRMILDKAQESYRVMSRRYGSWNEIDKSLTAYIPASEAEERIQDADERKPISIVIPYSYATLETILTYLCAAFIQDPVFRYEGTGPEDVIGAILLEMVVASQCNYSKIGLPLHTMFRDSLSYGLGIVAPTWVEHHGYKTVVEDQPRFSFLGMDMGSKKAKKTIEAVLFEGNSLTNIDPYRFLPDCNYSIHEIQKMEFVGWMDTVSLMDLLAQEQYDEDLFNVKYLKLLNSRRSTYFSTDESAREVRQGGSSRDRFSTSEAIIKPVDTLSMFIKICPKDYGLPGGEFNPNGEYPEKWFFSMGADQIILSAKPMGLNHNLYPVAACAPDFDGRSITPISRLEIIYGLQHTLNFMFNSHVENCRKAINDMLVVDPFLVNMKDLRDPQPGKLIRLRRSAWGRGVTDVVQQLKVTDVTQNHIADSARIMDMMERVTAATSNMQGIMRPGSERRSATEFEGTQGAALNRLERLAKVIGLQAMQDIGYMFASQTQQLMSQEVYMNILGESAKQLMAEYGQDIQNNRLLVNPMDLVVDFDVKVRDGSVPGGNFSRVWIELFQIAASQPTVSTRVDLFRVFKHIARNLGAKDVADFELKIPPQGMGGAFGGLPQPRAGQGGQTGPPQLPQMNTQIMPDEQVAQQAQAGNIVPFPTQA